MTPQLQVGHWYLVVDGDGHVTIRSYMHDGWYPVEPHPQQAVCEMSRTHHPDNVRMPDEVEVSEIDRALIEHHYPPAAEDLRIARGIRGMAEAFCLANGKEWDWERPGADPKDHLSFLAMAAQAVKSLAGETPKVSDINDVMGDGPLSIFRPRKWPSEVKPGALVLERSQQPPDPAAAASAAALRALATGSKMLDGESADFG